MKRLIIAATILAASSVAHAVDIEVAAGVAHYQPRGNMMWYQEGFPHTLNLNAPTFQIGLTDTLWQRGRWGIDWHADYVYLGEMRSDAIATDDGNYNKYTRSCEGQCTLKNRFQGKGWSHGVKLSIEPTYTFNGWRFGVEAGAFIHQNRWDTQIDFRPYYADYATTMSYELHTDRRWQVMPMVGVSVGRGPVSVAATYYANKSRNDPVHSFWQGTATLTVRYRF